MGRLSQPTDNERLFPSNPLPPRPGPAPDPRDTAIIPSQTNLLAAWDIFQSPVFPDVVVKSQPSYVHRVFCPTVHSIQLHAHQHQCDMGANVSVTPLRDILDRHCAVRPPLNLAGIDATSTDLLCHERGIFGLRLDNGTLLDVPVFVCQHVSSTVLSPQSICQHHPVVASFDIVCRESNNPHVVFYDDDTAEVGTASMVRRDGLFYFRQLVEQPATVHRTAAASTALDYELWHQRLGHPGLHQLQHLPAAAHGVPSTLAKAAHPLRYCTICADAHALRPSRGPTVDTTNLAPSSRFHVDFGFMRASSSDYGATKTGKRIVASFDGFTAYLLIVDATTRYTWVFPTTGKQPPTDILKQHLSRFGRTSGLRVVRMDHGGELYGARAIHDVVMAAGYVIEATGSGVHHRNGKVERLNRTFAVQVRALLYGSGLPATFWSAALIHAVYLKNRLWHSAIGKTPFEAWNGAKPDLSHLRVFGSLVTERRPNQPAAKLDRHTYHGIFLGYTGNNANIRYIDLLSGVVKVGATLSFDEAHYMSVDRPPAAQLLYDMGMQTLPSEHAKTPIPVPTNHDKSPKPAVGPVRLPSDTATSRPNGSVPIPIPAHAAAAVVRRYRLPDRCTRADIDAIDVSNDPFSFSFKETVNVDVDVDGAGLVLVDDPDRHRPILRDIRRGCPAHRVKFWRSRLRKAHLLRIGGVDVHSVKDAHKLIREHREAGHHDLVLEFAHDEAVNALGATGLIHLYFDQWRDIRDLREAARATVRKTAISKRLTRSKLKLQDDWEAWRAAEHAQLSQYDKQGMFGKPVPRRNDAPVFRWIWVYVLKNNPTETRHKARAACDGSPRAGQAEITGHTFTSTPDQTDIRLFTALTAHFGLKIYGTDVSNAFAEADRGAQEYYMEPDAQFRDWWHATNRAPIPEWHVIPVLKNLQGHPEAPRQWALHIDRCIKNHGLRAVTHAKCLYIGHIHDTVVLLLRQVDDFAIGAVDDSVYGEMCDRIDSDLSSPLKRFGLITHFNGIDFVQTKHYVTVHCGTYLSKVFERHGWEDLNGTQLPMQASNAHLRALDDAEPADPATLRGLQQIYFPYRRAMGELIWPMVTCRPEISFPVIKLSQFSTHPAEIHFKAAKHVMRFLKQTRTHGITFWRRHAIDALPDLPPPPPMSPPTDIVHQPAITDFPPDQLFGYADSDWAMDTTHRRSISGIIYKLSGGPVAWKCRVQTVVAHSSTEAELICAADAGRMALCMRSILDEVGVPQRHATVLYEDNQGAVLVANAGQSTKHTRHIDIKTFAIQDWVEQDLLLLEKIETKLNAADLTTKQLGRQPFLRHWDNVAGRLVPSWASASTSTSPSSVLS